MKNARPTKEHPVLLLLDNHFSHLSINALDYATANGIVMLSFPPHCTHKLQPLDRTVFGPFKKALNTAMDNWMLSNPGKAMTIYNIPEIAKVAFPLSMTPKNILSGFSSCGIHPFNPQIFSDFDFAPSLVTDRPLPVEASSELVASQNSPSTSIVALNLSLQEPSTSAHVESFTECSGLVTPDKLRPLPKALERNPSKTVRKKRTSTILTDSPFKKSVRESQSQPKKLKHVAKGKGKGKAIKKNIQEPSSSDDENYCVICMDTWSNSKSAEKWIKCLICSNWAHEECTAGGPSYICHNCDSDEDS